MPVCLTELSRTLQGIDNIFALEKPVMTGRLPCMIVSDLHEKMKALDFVIRMWQSSRYPQLLFPGDYANRRNAHVDAFGQKLLSLFPGPEYCGANDMGRSCIPTELEYKHIYIRRNRKRY